MYRTYRAVQGGSRQPRKKRKQQRRKKKTVRRRKSRNKKEEDRAREEVEEEEERRQSGIEGRRGSSGGRRRKKIEQWRRRKEEDGGVEEKEEEEGMYRTNKRQRMGGRRPTTAANKWAVSRGGSDGIRGNYGSNIVRNGALVLDEEQKIHTSVYGNGFESTNQVKTTETNLGLQTAGWLSRDQQWALRPVGARFQALVPNWTSQPTVSSTDSDTLKWLGKQMWPPENQERSPVLDYASIGRGRPNICQCEWPGSVECIRFHIAEKRLQLKRETGATFHAWKCESMGEEVALSWTEEEEKKFRDIIVQNRPSLNKNFWDQLYLNFPYKRRESLKQNKYGSGHCPPRIVLLYCPTLFPSFKPNYEGSKSYLLLCSSYPLSLPLIAGDLTTDYEPVTTRLKSGFPTDVAVKKELDYC
ncbi:hypothetical protein GW17_00043682 [Ensete ventricosum]|nr:hypothetical protein GW17_00043682 [Ensete ventricosum]